MIISAEDLKEIIADTSITDDGVFIWLKEYLEDQVSKLGEDEELSESSELGDVLMLLCEKRHELFNLLNFVSKD